MMMDIPSPAKLSEERFDRAAKYLIERLHVSTSPRVIYVSALELSAKAAFVSPEDMVVLTEAFVAAGWWATVELGTGQPTIRIGSTPRPDFTDDNEDEEC